MDLERFRRHPNALAPHYSRFRVADRLLLTGHSHQAWPDRARDGQIAAWDDAAERVDRKWKLAFAQADRVRRGLARRLDDEDASADYALAANTHELLIRLLSALPLTERRRLVTTDGEFHTIRRQLDRLAEEGFDVVKVAAEPVEDVADRLIAAVDDSTAAVLVSAVFFGTGRIAHRLDEVLAAAERVGAETVVDTYHVVNALPYSLAEEGLTRAWVVGGGYKYLQMGEGNAFLRVPAGRNLRPLITGWYAEFDRLAARTESGKVGYGPGAAAFGGATYDPTSHYRGAAVLDFFDDHGLDPATLRAVSQHQVGLLAALFDRLDLPPGLVSRDREVPLSEIGGFLALSSPRAGDFQRALGEAGVATDHRDGILRLGPAPYLSDRQLEEAMGRFAEVARRLAAEPAVTAR